LPRIKNPPKEENISPNEIITCETYVGLYGPQIKIPDGVDWFENNDNSSFNSTKEPLTYYVKKISSSVQFKQIKNLSAVNLSCCTTFKREEKLACVLVEKSTIIVSTRESIKLNSCNTQKSSTKVSTSITKSIENSTITSSSTAILVTTLQTSTTTITTYISNRAYVILIKTQMLLFLIMLSRILEW
jgi:hypothetical protein